LETGARYGELCALNVDDFNPTPVLNIDNISGFVAYGRTEIGGPLKIIPKSYWEAGEIEWGMSRLIMDGKVSWFGVRVIELSKLSEDLLAKVLGDAGISDATRRKIGRPIENNWDGADMAAEQYIQKNGIPPQQPRLVELYMEWLQNNDGKSPHKRTVERYVSKKYYDGTA